MSVHQLREIRDGRAVATCGYQMPAPTSRQLPPTFTAWSSKVTCTSCPGGSA